MTPVDDKMRVENSLREMRQFIRSIFARFYNGRQRRERERERERRGMKEERRRRRRQEERERQIYSFSPLPRGKFLEDPSAKRVSSSW